MVKCGGLKMLRIEDGGHGIRADDLPILCERFTTSKLQKYEDLLSIGTFGFRGEALASISHVAHVTVTTMTSTDTCANLATYSEGKLQGQVRPCAGTPGTTLVVENMFYNNPTRRQALGKESIEHSKVLEVVQRYAIHYPNVGFTCRKYNGSFELTTLGGSSPSEVIATIWGQNLAQELFAFDVKSEEPRFSCRGFASNPNYSSRVSTLILFINNRLVESASLKRAVEAVYQPVLPRHQHPWVYLALDVDPTTIDVNVHPTKMEVQFLHEETISQRLQETLASQLRSAGSARSFASVLPSPARGTFTLPVETKDVNTSDKDKVERRQVPNPTRVRTDHRQMSLETIFRESQASQGMQIGAGADAPTTQAGFEVVDSDRMAAFEEAQQLTSVEELRKAVDLACDEKFSTLLNQSIYVGPVNHELVLLQCGASLCLANLAILARECAYQRLLRLIGGFGCMTLEEPLPLSDLMKLGLRDPQSGYDENLHAHEDMVSLERRFEMLLLEKADLLREYFMLEIEEVKVESEETNGVSSQPRQRRGFLKSIPNGLGLSSDVGCCFDSFPLCLVRLCSEVDWSDEKSCLDGICQVIADFCADLLLPSPSVDISRAATDAWNAAVAAGEFEDVAAAATKRPRTSPQELQGLRWLHEAVRKGLCKWPTNFTKDGTVLDLVSLDQLYKIFERC
ncbi:unnamed protein product [Durusdinium trenchii]|uniref:DNA mismatch repair protein S5 domain-containing protein n=1 Tax=Durusdinium trenchii TaxID=1381693 RepID=A0ABP0LPD2_9DINO